MDERPPVADRYEAAAALDRQGRADEAIPLLEALIAEDPTHVHANALLGTIHAIADRFDAALPLLERAAALAPQSGAIMNNLGNLLSSMGRYDDALEAFERSLVLRPGYPRTLHNRGKLLRRMGKPEDALGAFEAALAIDDEFADAWYSRASLLSARAYHTRTEQHRREAARGWRDAIEHKAAGTDGDFALAALGEGEPPPIAPRHYVQGLFDRYATRFEHHLRVLLEYRTPEFLCAQALRDVKGGGLEVVDLGCGTGLCAPLLRASAARLTGVDLSSGMLGEALGRGQYDRLVHADVVDHLLAHPDTYDLAVAADVLVYIGDLAPLFAAASKALRPGGRLAVSVEHFSGEGYVLLPTRRYAHSPGYVQSTAASAGLVAESAENCTLRREAAAQVEGTLFVLRRPAG